MNPLANEVRWPWIHLPELQSSNSDMSTHPIHPWPLRCGMFG